MNERRTFVSCIAILTLGITLARHNFECRQSRELSQSASMQEMTFLHAQKTVQERWKSLLLEADLGELGQVHPVLTARIPFT